MELKLTRSHWKSLTIFVIAFVFAVLFSFLFVISFTTDIRYYLYGVRSVRNTQLGGPDITKPETWLDKLIRFTPTIAQVATATGTISSGIIAWRVSRRDARERDLKIEKLELELRALKEKEVNPKD